MNREMTVMSNKRRFAHDERILTVALRTKSLSWNSSKLLISDTHESCAFTMAAQQCRHVETS